MGSVAAEPSKWLSQDQYWFVEKGASTSTTEDGEQVVTSRTLDAGDTVAYCTLNTAQTGKVDSTDEDGFPIEVDGLIFNNIDDNAKIPPSGYFVNMSAKFAPREAPQVSAISDFPYRTLLYVTTDNHLAFLERDGEKCAAKEVVTQTVVDPDEDEPLEITVQILYANEKSTFRVYVNSSEGWAEVVAQGKSEARAYRSLQDGKTERYYAEYLHSFAFTGSVELSAIDFTTEVPDWMEEMNSIPFVFTPDDNAVKNIVLREVDGETESDPLTEWKVQRSKTYKVTFTADTTQYVYGELGFAESIAQGLKYTKPAEDTKEALGSITFTVADALTQGSTLALTLPTNAYFFTLDGKKYGTFTEIIAAASGSSTPILLTHDINLDDSKVSPGSQAVVKTGQNVVLDLNGKTIKGLKADHDTVEDAAIVNLGTLKIIDSDPDKKGKVVANGFVLSLPNMDDMYALRNSANETIIKAGTFVGIVTNVAGRIQIDGGRFLKVFDDDTAADFYLRRQEGISIGARFDNATFTSGTDGEFWTGNENEDLIEFRVDTPSYATLSQKLYSKADYEGGSRPTVTAAGYNIAAVNWLEKDEYDMVRGILTAEKYDIYYDVAGKATIPSSAPTSYTVDADKIALPELTNDHWDFMGWYVREGESDKKVSALGEFATYEGTERPLPEGLIYGELNLIAKWEPKTFSWTNAKTGRDYIRMTEANGFFAEEDVEYSWNLVIPASNGFETGSRIRLESITLSTVNASPNNLARTAPKLKLNVGGEVYYVAEREDFAAKAAAFADKAAAQDKFEPSLYFETNFGFRPKIVYSFGDAKPLLTVGESYPFSLVGASEASVLLRLVKKTGDDKLDVIGVSSPLPGSSLDYQSYVPMFKIIGKAADANEGAE